MTGRGATALWLAYSLVSRDRPKILLPAMSCLSPMFTVQYANRIPIFADVRISDATIDPGIVERTIKQNPDIGAVVAIHLYGHPASMDALEKICAGNRVMLIEDFAQALGGRDEQGRILGARGDVSVVSFGHTKILDVGGGGALLTDDGDLANKARVLLASLGARSQECDRLGSMYSRLYYAIWECGRVETKFLKLFDQFPELFQDLYLYKLEEAQAKVIENSLSLIPDEVAYRRGITAVYRDALSTSEEIMNFTTTDLYAPWRFTFRVKQELRDNMLQQVREKGFDISSWYPCITDWTPSGREQGSYRFPIANQIEKEVVNLWVTKDYTMERAKKLADTIKTLLEKS